MVSQAGPQTWVRAIIEDRALLWNLALRLLIWGWVVWHGSYLQGDSAYYLKSAQEVCDGAWGGDSFRVPFYFWFLCGFSFGGIGLALLVQTLCVWSTGVWLRGRLPRALVLLWLFDPVLLVYSNIVMTDALFAVSLFFTAVGIRRLILDRNLALFPAVFAGLGLSVTTLLRPIGTAILALTLAMGGVQFLRKEIKLFPLVIFLFATFLGLSPRLYWNHSRHATWKLATQGENFFQDVASVVEFNDRGYNFLDSETQWNLAHPHGGVEAARRSILEHLPTLGKLTAKSVARIWLGHVNVELGTLATGVTPVGPGWFKNRDTIGTQQLSPASFWTQLLWFLGIVVMLGYLLWIYFHLGRILIVHKKFDFFGAWTLASIVALSITPLVYGDARFRIPIFVLLMVWVGSVSRDPKSSDPLGSGL